MSTKKTAVKTTAKPEADNTPITNEPTGDVIGSLKGGKEVHQKLKTVRIKAMRGPISHRMLPEDIQQWLKNKWYGTNIYQKDKEWLIAHKVDMEMVEKLKKFINDNYL